MFSPDQIKIDFPIFAKQVHGKPLIYLDNAATSQKPLQVIDAISNYYKNSNANVHRGVHQLSEESTTLYEQSRKVIANFFGAEDEELILVRNTTEAINGVAYGWALDHVKDGDVILTTEMEHHSNVVPWQEICKRVGAKLEFIEVSENGELDQDHFKQLISTQNVKLLVLTHVSNTLGTLNPVQEMANALRKEKPNAKVLVDGAQSAPHIKIDFHNLGVDFFIFSGHKMLGPMGVGGLLVKKELVKKHELKPWLFGGGMIEAVYLDHTIFHDDAQDRFTAGTPDVASAVGLAEACTYLEKLGMKNVHEHDAELILYTIEKLQTISEIHIVGPTNNQHPTRNNRVGSVAFLYEGVHPHDVAQILDSEGIAVRSGHHCTMPLHTKFHWPGTVRVSFQIYNSKEDIDAFISALAKVKQVFKK